MFVPLSEASLAEVRSMTKLAVPVVLAEMGWFAMSIVDTVMVALSNYGASPNAQDGWGVESEDVINDRLVVLAIERFFFV